MKFIYLTSGTTLLTDNNKYLNDNKVIGGTPGYMSQNKQWVIMKIYISYRYIYVMCIVISDITLQPPHTGKNTETIVQNSSKDLSHLLMKIQNQDLFQKHYQQLAEGLSIHPDERYSNISSLKDIRSYLNYATLAENPNL